MSRHTRRFIPRLEAFDARIQPAVTFQTAGNTLFVTGDTADNTITITDNGQAGGLTLTGENGELFSTFGSTINSINVDAGAGNDKVTYNLTNTLTVTHFITVHLGAGNDTFTANLDGQTLAPLANLPISAYGEGGKDTFNLNAQRISLGANPGDPTSSAQLNVYFEGGAGKDAFNLNYSLVDGDVSKLIVNTKSK